MSGRIPSVISVMLLVGLGGCATTGGVETEGAGALAPLAWLAGSWSGGATQELWTTPRGGAMLGVNRTVVDGRMVAFEHLRIVRDDDGSVGYLASPGGRFPPTRFELVELDAIASPPPSPPLVRTASMIQPAVRRAVFENPRHDFPQRIVYELRPPGELTLRVEGEEAGETKSAEWVLTRDSE